MLAWGQIAKAMLKKKGSQTIKSGDNSINVAAGRDAYFNQGPAYPVDLVDKNIVEEIDRFKRSRFYTEFDRIRSALRLGNNLIDGTLTGGSAEVRGRALAWCARLLARSEHIKEASTFHENSTAFGDFPESSIAKAFLLSEGNDKESALKLLNTLDSDEARTAALMIVGHDCGAEDALNWWQKTGYSVQDLDSDGRGCLLDYHLGTGEWDGAQTIVAELSDNDYESTPFLLHLSGLTNLISAIPKEYRRHVLSGVPFDVVGYPLASRKKALASRAIARDLFIQAAVTASQLGCPVVSSIDEEYAMWLELRDPVSKAEGLLQLQGKLRDPNLPLRMIRFAYQFGLKVDQDQVEMKIERSIAQNGGITSDAAIARLAIAMAQHSPEEIATYLATYHSQLAAFIDPIMLRYREIEMLSKAGLLSKAKGILDELISGGLPEDQVHRLQHIIDESRDENPVESRLAQYEATKSLDDLINLVLEMERSERWEDVTEYGRVLLDQTQSTSDAERLANALNNVGLYEELVEFLRGNSEFISQSQHLNMLYAWGLFQIGELTKSREILATIPADVDGHAHRKLQVNLAITTGDWVSITAYVAKEYDQRSQRNASELIEAAQLARQVDSPYTKRLVMEAVGKGGEDPAVLVTAYGIATSAGWEETPQIFSWIDKAARMSGSDGPIKRMSLKEILSQKPDWDRQQSDTWHQLSMGQIPIFIAAAVSNRTLLDLTAFPAYENLAESDVRSRSLIPAFSGLRQPAAIDYKRKTVSLDSTSLILLGFLGILDVVLDAFEKVFIPHSTLGWLFEEKGRATFHQPSRIQDAHRVRDLLATGTLERFVPTALPNADLVIQVGEDLADLIVEAEAGCVEDTGQFLVVRSAPVHRISSLLEEEADLSQHESVLSSCFAVVEFLRKKGLITTEEFDRAGSYLHIQERPWNNQPVIADGATLYLDDLSVRYLLHLGMLSKLKIAGFRVFVSPDTIRESNALISYEGLSQKVLRLIESIRALLETKIESGQVRVGQVQKELEFGAHSIPAHPSIAMFSMASSSDIAVLDDRFFNQHLNLKSNEVERPVITTLDLLDSLTAATIIAPDDRRRYRTLLRKAGYCLVPTEREELEYYLLESPVVDGVVQESAELKAIRESILQVRMREILNLPQEVPWLDGTLKVFTHTIRGLWQEGLNSDEVIARSDWLMNQIDVRGWAHSFSSDYAKWLPRTGRANQILLLLSPLVDVEVEVVDKYWAWVEERFLAPIKEQFPELYEWLLDWHRNYISSVTLTQSPE